MNNGKYVDIKGSKIHYLEQGSGDPILFLHSIPTSSYVWRNVIPRLATLGRCIAPDLIGMGKSDKPDIAYSLADHISYLNVFIETLALKRITLVMHGWGSILGFDYAMRHEKNCKGLVFYEAYLCPLNQENFSLPFQEQIFILQKQKNILDNGKEFVMNVVNQGLLTSLNNQDMNYYCEPFLKKGSGKPLQQYLNELLNEKEKVNAIIANYSPKLMKSSLPKLLLYSVPGFTTTMEDVVWAKENIANLEMIDIGEALHYAQEADPALMGETISIWLQGVEQSA